MKASGDRTTDIDIETLSAFFSKRFSDNEATSDIISNAKSVTDNEFYKHDFYDNDNISITKEDVISYIKRLKCGRSGGNDGILPEHLKYGLGSGIAPILSTLLTTCVRFSVIPTTFHIGTLIPVLKKTTLDPTVAKSYRPIIVSTIFSKLLEYAILDSTSSHTPHGLQFDTLPSGAHLQPLVVPEI